MRPLFNLNNSSPLYSYSVCGLLIGFDRKNAFKTSVMSFHVDIPGHARYFRISKYFVKISFIFHQRKLALWQLPMRREHVFVIFRSLTPKKDNQCTICFILHYIILFGGQKPRCVNELEICISPTANLNPPLLACPMFARLSSFLADKQST